MTDFEKDKVSVLSWFEKHCPNSKEARTRENILPFILIHKTFPTAESKDRYARRIFHELIHEGNIASHNSKGYWFYPLCSTDPVEIAALKMSLLERKAKALSMLSGCDKQLARVEEMESRVNHGQQELAYRR